MLPVPLTYLGDSFGGGSASTPRPRSHRILIVLRIVMMIICAAMLFLLAVVPGKAQESNEEIVITIPAKNMKDQQQDDHLRFDDRRINTLEAWKEKHETERKDISAKRDSQYNDLQNQVTTIRSYGAGAFGLLLILQAIGVKMQFRAGKQTT